MTPGFFMALDFGSQGLFSWLELFLIVESSPNLSWLRDVLGSFVVYFACVYFNGFSKLRIYCLVGCLSELGATVQPRYMFSWSLSYIYFGTLCKRRFQTILAIFHSVSIAL
ncbi:hypothetical protein SCA6_003985 [Theobroma cacao]